MIHTILRPLLLAGLAGASLSAGAACVTTSISPDTALPSGSVGAPYSRTITASGVGPLPYDFAITSGASSDLGLSLNAIDGTNADLTGTPTRAGRHLFTVTATDTSGCSGGRTYALDVAPGEQTIGFTSTAPTDARFGGAPYTVSASATSGLPVTFAIDPTAASVCSIAGSTVSFLGVGTCVIDADQAGDADWNAAPRAQQSFAVGRASQTITFTSTVPTAAAVGGAPYAVAATASSGLPVSFSIDASAAAVCSIAGSSVSFHGAGTCVIDADQAGDASYEAAPRVQQSFAVGRASQTITFTSPAPAAAVVGGAPYVVAATASSGLPVSFSIDASAASVCSIAGSSVSFHGAGTCVIDADQAGDADWNAAPRVQQSFAVGQGSQTITFTSTVPAAAVVGGAPYAVAATASSGLPVSFSVDASAAAVCSIAGSSVSFHGAGTCVIDADQAGNADWNAAPRVQQGFAVGQGSQTITFTSTVPAAAVVGGAPYAVAATASSGLPVSFSIDASAAAVCSIAGSSVSFHGAGTCVIDADQAGNANWSPAPRVQQSFAVGRASQTITFTSTAPTAAAVGGAPYAVAATASSGLAVSFSIDPSATAVCSIAGSSVSFHGVGTCVIDADQAGDADWNAAPRVQQSFAVGRGSQTITFTSTAPATAVVGGAPYAVAATASSGLAVSFSIDPSAAAVCSIAGSSVSFHGTGTCVIDADQAGNANYQPAPRVQQSFVVGRGAQTLGFTSVPPAAAVVGGPAYTVVATSSAGLAVSLTIDPVAASVCSIAGSSVSFHAAGTCVIDADQAGNANYEPAPRAQQSFAVGQGDQSISFTSTAPTNAVVAGATYTPSASASSGLPVTLTIDAASASVCSITAGAVSFQHAGTCTIDANQAGDANYHAAPQVQQSVAVGKGSQVLSFTSTAPGDAVVAGATYTPSAVSSAGLPVSLTIDPAAAAVCSISGGVVSFQGAGLCVIDADQTGDADWNAAPRVQQSFAVGMGSQTITFTSTAPGNARVGGPAYTVAASASSGLPVVFSIDPSASAICSIAGDTVTFLAVGTCVINADQPGNADWNAAPRVQQSFAVIDCLTLAVGQVLVDGMPGGAGFCIQNDDAANVEFTYLPINIAATSEVNLSVAGTGVVAVTGPPTPIAPTGSSPLAPLAEPMEQPEIAYHTVETEAFPPGHVVDAASLVPPYHLNAGPLTVGQLIDLNAAVGGCSGTPDVRKARVEAITTPQSPGQQVLYAVQEVVETTPGAGDWHAPVPGGYATIDFQAIIDSFVQAPPGRTAPGSGTLGGQLKTGMMDTFSGAFGALSDVDNNGGVIVFFTPKMNELSPPASSVIQMGLFQPRDLFSAASCSNSNEAEILYMLVPDPTGVVNSNVRTVSLAYGNAGPTLVHHYEHLINASRRLYFNGAAPMEEAWLDEALAWSAQELAFFNASVGLTPRSNIVVTNLTTGPNASTRVADFNTYQNPMYGAMRTYFMQLGASNGSKRLGPLRRSAYSSGLHDVTAANFAHTYMFLRYAIDRKNTGDAALFGALVNTTQTGVANLQTVFGVDPNDWMRDFLVAVYTDDAVAGVDARYSIPSWNLRSLYIALNGSYPLTTDVLADGVPLSFTLSPGGGTRYVRFGVAPGQRADVALTQGGAPPGSTVTMALVRTK